MGRCGINTPKDNADTRCAQVGRLAQPSLSNGHGPFGRDVVRACVANTLALCGLLLVSGCSGSRSGAPAFDPIAGKHPPTWRVDHPLAYVRTPATCRNCHGSTTQSGASGGISGVSCFRCHGSPDHPQGWALRTAHGRTGAQGAPGTYTGFASCTKCHGQGETPGVGAAPSCMACHTRAPHPNAPWLADRAALATHTVTHEGNAPVCFVCHANGAHSHRQPETPPAVGAQPGCYNNTLCHDRSID